MSDELEEDLNRYDESGGSEPKRLDDAVLLRSIATLRYPKNPETVSAGTPIGTVLKTMTSKRFGAVLVVENGRVVGIFTERDALMKGLYNGAAMDHPVSEFMTADPACLSPHDSIAMALNRMAVGGYRHVPLVDGGGRAVGILVMRDVVRHVVAHFPAEVLNQPPHSEHAPPDHSADGG
jgi:CBS domain-containing protein